jgi:hypothetical protein
MRRYATLLLALLMPMIALTLTACGNNYAHPDEWSFPSNTIHRNDILADIDYMMDALDESFPYFGIIYRMRGRSLWDIADETRQAFLAAPEYLDANEFFRIFNAYFFDEIGGIGNIFAMDMRRYHTFLSAIARDREQWPNHNTTRFRYNRLTCDAAIALYGNLAYVERAEANPYNLTTQIIEDGRIAYVHVQTFNRVNLANDRIIMNEFYDEIVGFEHLIVDIRGVNEGVMDYFMQLFVRPNAVQAFGTQIMSFHNIRSERIEEIMQVRRLDMQELPPYPMGLWVHLGNNFIGREDFTNIPWLFTTEFSTRGTTQSNFDGDIWFLIDASNAGVATVAAYFIRNADKSYRLRSSTSSIHRPDFATLVGWGTGGKVNSEERLLLVLPSTGLAIEHNLALVTNFTAHNFEEHPVWPDFLNRDGKDALETTLALIAEGVYRN